jgi:hypothetical protein
MNELELSKHSPKMQEAIRFVEHWCLAKSTTDFILAMGWPLEQKSYSKAAVMARRFRKPCRCNVKFVCERHGVPLRRLGQNQFAQDYDYSYLKMVGEKAMAVLANRREEAERAVGDIDKARAEAFRILSELRKLKHRAIALTELVAEGEIDK